MLSRVLARLILVVATVSLFACDSGSGGVQVFREPAQNIPPTAIFSVSVTEGKVPLSDVQFDASQSYDTNGNITNFVWDFGDGVITSGVDDTTPVHSYIDEGSFVVILTVTDNDNATNTNLASQTITVLPNQPPDASFIWSVGTDGLTASLDAGPSADSDGSIIDYAWDFG